MRKNRTLGKAYHGALKGSMTFVRACLPVAAAPRVHLRFPNCMALAFDPVTRDGIAFKVAVFVTESLLQQLQKGVPKGGIHTDALAGVVTPNTVTSKALFEKGFIERAATVEAPRGCHARRVSPAFPPSVVPRAKSIACAVQGAEKFDSGVIPRFPGSVKGGRHGRCWQRGGKSTDG